MDDAPAVPDHVAGTLTARVPLTVALLAALLAALATASPARAQSDTARTTLAGVFSAEQAERGKDFYLSLCQSCHTAVTHTGPVFRRNWSGRSLAELYTFMSSRMPKNEPASLAPEVYADLLAYVLLMNKMPAGAGEITPDPAALQSVRIQFTAPPKRTTP
jgi:hypothetical protein